jgi:hypothetical protein
MASSTTGITSGADFDSQATRRRNVPSTSPSGGLVNQVEIDEKKTQVNQVSHDAIATSGQSSLDGAANKFSFRANRRSYKSVMNGSLL